MEKKVNNSNNSKSKKVPLPLIATRGIVLFPGIDATLDIGRRFSYNAVMLSLKQYDGDILVVSQKDPSVDDPKIKDLNTYGAKCKVEIIKNDLANKASKENDLKIRLVVYEKIKITNPTIDKNGIIFSNFEIVHDSKKLTEEKKNILLQIYGDIKDKLRSGKEYNEKSIAKIFEKSQLDGRAVDFLCSLLFNASYQDLQKILSELDPNKRLEKYLALSMSKEETQKIDLEITKTINKNLSKQQKEFYLRERLRVIKEELGDISTKGDDAESMREKIRNNPYPEHIKKRLLSEISKMEVSSNTNESSIIKSYIDTLLELPWWQKTEDSKDLENVIKILDKSHYGLEKVKETIIEYLAVRMRSEKATGSVLCLVGPPGVGKTTLAKSIAEALGKKFAKISLGGMRDEAEIKGHRKTYIGAMPGRIIKEMKKVGVINPLFLLDEIDKISSDQRGDPASTLLDILDIEQNKYFSDNYIEEEYDLSNVFFIATANYEENIPEALRDRLEIIRLNSYTENEKQSIAEKYLVPKILDESNISKKQLDYTKEGISYIIKRYTREAGVREIERCIRKIARKFVVEDSKNKIGHDVINIERVKHYLKKEIFDYTNKDKVYIPGVVNGMAYTAFGGDLLPIEVAIAKGKGKIHITGNLKETMKESVSVAFGFVKVNAEKFGINLDFSELDFHIHVPTGGVPKDGPSAGVALTTAIISALKKYAVPSNISMTGEITLRGKVLIIGGVKEKIISAVRGGVNEIFIPKDDERYLDDVPNDILKKIKIHLVNNYDDIYNEIFK